MLFYSNKELEQLGGAKGPSRCSFIVTRSLNSWGELRGPVDALL